ncbi:manganese efflux pump MntP family protein [Murdochiella vaginalis]|uniref:manganese efflux pump MntP n=1 Tax=Murdochiella vaginalis TaxID=1852373 RepID=UPI0008FDE1F9|nr:manganese efflux pump MntP family protein [Murdochiella vaginalis]
MTFFELLLLAVGVSLDAFSVAICKGLAVQELHVRHGLVVGAYFGGFQGLMPLLGFLLGSWIAQSMRAIDHWVILLILGYLGIQMVREARNPESCPTGDFSWSTMFPLAVATSIDAFAVGVTFAMMEIDLWMAIPLIAVCTGLFSFAGVYIGHYFGQRYQKPAGIVGGAILLFIGLRVFITHWIQGI